MVKVKRVRTIDAVLVGWRPGKEPDTVGALILGLYDGERAARRRALLRAERAEKNRLVGFLAPYESGERGSADPSRWSAGKDLEWVGAAPRAGRRDRLRPRLRRAHPPRRQAAPLARGQGPARVHVSRTAAARACTYASAEMSGERPATATVAEEEYLQILFWLQEAGLPMTGANVARAMQLSPPTVHEMIGRLERDGYITRGADRAIAFTDTGAEHAEGIVRRHRLIERFLTDVLGVPWDEVHEEAERLEHAMSPVLEERMLAAIGDAKTCPHGHPIVAGARLAGVPLADVEVGATVRVLRFENEAEDLLHYLKASGLEPGLEAVIAERGAEHVELQTADGRRLGLTASVAETVSVIADPSPPARTALPEQLVLGQRYGR